MDLIRVHNESFDPTEEIKRLSKANASMGAVVSFIGTMRDVNEGDKVTAMTLEHYPGMTEKALQQIVHEARRKWPLDQVSLIHRVGRILPTEAIVLVAVTAAHRGEAFDACEYIIDFLKTRAPFWKKEETEKGSRWVDARESDDRAFSQWQKS